MRGLSVYCQLISSLFFIRSMSFRIPEGMLTNIRVTALFIGNTRIAKTMKTSIPPNESGDIENRSAANAKPRTNPDIIVPNRMRRMVLNGVHTLNNITNPTTAISIAEMVDVSLCGMSKATENSIVPNITKISVIAAGAARSSTLRKNFPRTMLVFGSRARKNDGAPIVSTFMSESGAGVTG